MSQTKQNTYAIKVVDFWGWKGKMQNKFLFQECLVKRWEMLFSKRIIQIKWSGTISYQMTDECILKAEDLNLEWEIKLYFRIYFFLVLVYVKQDVTRPKIETHLRIIQNVIEVQICLQDSKIPSMPMLRLLNISGSPCLSSRASKLPLWITNRLSNIWNRSRMSWRSYKFLFCFVLFLKPFKVRSCDLCSATGKAHVCSWEMFCAVSELLLGRTWGVEVVVGAADIQYSGAGHLATGMWMGSTWQLSLVKR